ncbi:MAG: NmrA family NAD(P)-binding protein [Vicinamibacterales bacterium]
MTDSPILVVGATGQLGGTIARALLAAGKPVRALARDASRLAPLRDAGAEVAAVDLRNLAGLTDACRGASQIVATANNNLGSGDRSPTKIDVSAYQNLCAAARNTGVRRLVYTSFRGVDQFSPVDIFRLKWYVEDAIRRSGVPHVMLRPTAFMETWIDGMLLADMRRAGTARIFGPGTNVTNYIAIADVAAFAVRILDRDDVVNEAVEVGGPSDLSMNDLVTLIERRLGIKAKRRHVPVAALRWLPPLVRPFSEVQARLMTLGYHAATVPGAFPGWKAAADRFGVAPRSVDDHLAALA